MSCAHCGVGGLLYSWTAAPCANGNIEAEYWLCGECDIAANARLLYLLGVEDAEARMEAYAAKVRQQVAGHLN